MTEEFRELTERVAKAMNFKDGTMVLITGNVAEDDIYIKTKGNIVLAIVGVGIVLKDSLAQLDDKDARTMRDAIKQVLIDDEEWRFQRKDVE